MLVGFFTRRQRGKYFVGKWQHYGTLQYKFSAGERTYLQVGDVGLHGRTCSRILQFKTEQ